MNMQRLKHWGQVALITVVVIGVFAGGSVQAKVYEKSQDSRSSQNSAEGKNGQAGSKKGDNNFISAGATLVADQIADINKPLWKKGWDFAKDLGKLAVAYVKDVVRSDWEIAKTLTNQIVVGVKEWAHQSNTSFRKLSSTFWDGLSIGAANVFNHLGRAEKHLPTLAQNIINFVPNTISKIYDYLLVDPKEVAKDGHMIQLNNQTGTCDDLGGGNSLSSGTSNGRKKMVYVNGIGTTWDAQCRTMNKIHTITCCDVVGIHNATQGFVKDIWQVGMDRVEDTNEVSTDKATVALSRLLDPNNVDYGKIELFCHSQGGSICSNAITRTERTLSRTNSYDKISQLKINTFGSAATNWDRGPDYTHYVATDDPVGEDFGVGDDNYLNFDPETKHKVKEFSTNSDVFGRNEAAFSGGTKEEIQVVSAKDLKGLQDTVTKRLFEKAKSEAASKLSADEALVPVYLSADFKDKTFDKKENDQAKNVKLTATVDYTLGIYKKEELTKFISSSKDFNVPKDFKLSVDESTINISDIKQNKDDISAKLSYNAVFKPEFDEKTIPSEISGKSESSAINKLKTTPGVSDATIVFSNKIPFLPVFVPFNKGNITVSIKSQ
jgi:hypothetical protein